MTSLPLEGRAREGVGELLRQCLPTHRISLGPDPRATLNTAQAANGPRVEPEGERWVWGDGANYRHRQRMRVQSELSPLRGRKVGPPKIAPQLDRYRDCHKSPLS